MQHNHEIQYPPLSNSNSNITRWQVFNKKIEVEAVCIKPRRQLTFSTSLGATFSSCTARESRSFQRWIMIWLPALNNILQSSRLPEGSTGRQDLITMMSGASLQVMQHSKSGKIGRWLHATQSFRHRGKLGIYKFGSLQELNFVFGILFWVGPLLQGSDDVIEACY